MDDQERQRSAHERARLEAEIDRLEGLVTERTDKLLRARAEVDRLRADPVIAGLVAARSGARRATSAVKNRLPGRQGARTAGARAVDAAPIATEAWRQRLPTARVADRIVADHGASPPPPASSPLVTIVVTGPGAAAGSTGTDGRAADTAWPNIEWIVAPEPVAGGPDAGSGSVLLSTLDRAAGEYVVFLPQSAVPAEPGWLARLVAGAESAGAAAVSPRILGIDEGAPAGAGTDAPEVRLLSRGVAFRPGPGMPVPEALGAGEDPFGPAARATDQRAIPGGTGLLVRRAAIIDLDLPPITRLDELAVEIGLRLRERGSHVAYVGSAVLWQRDVEHRQRPGGKQHPADSWQGLHARWGPRLHRQVWREALARPGEWASRPLRAAIVSTTSARAGLHEAIAAALGADGWQVDPPGGAPGEPAPDVRIALVPGVDPPGSSRDSVRIGWIADVPLAWAASPEFGDLDLLVADSATRPAAAVGGRPIAVIDGPAGLPAAIAEWLERVRFAVHIGPADWTVAEHWGDTPFGRAIARQLEVVGHPASVVVYAERDDPVALRADVALHIVGTRRPPLRPSQTNLLWIISHPDAVRAARCAAYDVVFVASDPFLDHLAAQVDVPLVALHQATDPERFWPEPGGPVHELLFVGNSRNRHRPVIDALAGTDHDLAVYGGNWRPDLLDPRYLKGAWIANEEVHRAYAAAVIVLNDHWPDMRDEGFISNRIYDVLASGGFVLSDPVIGLEGEFDGAVATWTDPEDLRASIERYLADPDRRRAMSERGRAAVLARHTFSQRAGTLVETARPYWLERPRAITASGPLPD